MTELDTFLTFGGLLAGVAGVRFAWGVACQWYSDDGWD